MARDLRHQSNFALYPAIIPGARVRGRGGLRTGPAGARKRVNPIEGDI